MVIGIVLIASIFVSVFLTGDSERGIVRYRGGYCLRFLIGVSLIVFGNVTMDIATRKPIDDDATPTLYSIENPHDPSAEERTHP